MLARLPPFSLVLGMLAVLMLAPAFVALIDRDWLAARGFIYSAIFVAFAAGILGTALAGRMRQATARAELVILLLTWIVAPLFAAAPLFLITPQLGFVGGYFEMMLCLTTTGGTAYSDLTRVPDSIHLWRGLVGWTGGLLTLTAAWVIFAPRRLAGFEVFASTGHESEEMGTQLVALGAATPAFSERLNRALRVILPIYTGFALVLALLFSALGVPGVSAVVHAASVISTTGVSPEPEGIASAGGFGAELVAAFFLVIAATRLPYAHASQSGSVLPWTQDPELRLMGALVLLTTATLFLRHWLGALTIDLSEEAGQDAGAAAWGAFFTSLSFLTTTGFISGYWESARDWSGLANPGLILLGLCAIGGGAATATGGIKLIRLYALIRHGRRELDRLAEPRAIVGVGGELRGILREGAFIAWAFIMLYMVAIMTVMLWLAMFGMPFEEALVASVAMLSNTGQAFSLVLEGARTLATTTTPERLIMAAAMVLGRIETLAVIALFNPDSWALFGFGTKRTGRQRSHAPDDW